MKISIVLALEKWLITLTTLVVKNKTMDAKKLKQISAELKKASALHKGQAVKIDKMLKSIKTKK